jgi:hypothetical protein
MNGGEELPELAALDHVDQLAHPGAGADHLAPAEPR